LGEIYKNLRALALAANSADASVPQRDERASFCD